MKKILIPFAAAGILLASCSNNESTKDSVEKADSINEVKTDSPSTVREPIKTDEETTAFLVKAANGGMAEVKLAQLAKEKAKDTAVQHFADMMIADHSAANEKVKALAAERNVTLPAEPDAEEQKKGDELSKKTGADFDKAYVNAMVKGHDETVEMFKKASGKVSDGAVKAFIDNTIPTLEHHYMRIKDIKKGMK
ncbi:MAG: DUF4142 domain-containing protein [Chitinophagaceae bacterium]